MFSQTKIITRQIDLPLNKLPLSTDQCGLLAENKLSFSIGLAECSPHLPSKMVLMHGMGACKEVFKKQLAFFSKTHHVIALDLPGHGVSTHISKMETLSKTDQFRLSESMYSLPGLISQVDVALTQLHIDRTSLIGWSLGGHIAYGLAIRRPEIVQCLITNGTPPINFCNDELPTGFTPWFLDTVVKDWVNNCEYYTRDRAEEIARRLGYVDVGNTDLYIVDSLMNADPLLRYTLYSSIRNQQTPPQELNIRSFLQDNRNIPVCFIEGEYDQGIQVKLIQHVAEQTACASFHLFEKTSHSVFEAHPEPFNRLASEFIAKTHHTHTPAPQLS